MKRLVRFAGWSILVVASVGAMGQAAAPVEAVPGSGIDTKGFKVKEIHPKEIPTPFPIDAQTPGKQSLEYRKPGQMTPADRELVFANSLEISRRAELQGIRLDEDAGGNGWEYEQAVCPVFPEHVILEYSRSNGRGDLSLFSVVVPRGTGHVRVIPARRRGYTLWTVSSSNALTINDFNHMVKEDGRGLSPDWLILGLCYGALAGGHVRAELQASSPAEEEYPLLAAPMLVVSRKGGAEVRFADSTPAPHGMNWTLYFTQNGQLKKVKHTEARVVIEMRVAGTAVETQGKPVTGGVVDIAK